jgi:hypothetical protein
MNKTFAHHDPSDESIAKIRILREKFSELQDAIDQCAPPSRERAVALTNLETAAMWAIKAVVMNDPKSEVEK